MIALLALALLTTPYDADVKGWIGYKAEAVLDFHAPLFTRKQTWSAWVVAHDGEPVRTELRAMTIDGKPATPAELAKAETDFNDPKHRKNAVAWPFSARWASDYVFSAVPGGMAFKAAARDARHGDGTMDLAADGRVTRLKYAPAVLPDKVSSAAFDVAAGPVPGLPWGVTRFEMRYEGGVGPLRGGMTLVQKQSGHRRFLSKEAALRGT